MTARADLRALAQAVIDTHAAHRAAMTDDATGAWIDAALSFEDTITPDVVLALLDDLDAAREALEQSLWHIGTDDDRYAINKRARGWKTSMVECADAARAALARLERAP